VSWFAVAAYAGSPYTLRISRGSFSEIKQLRVVLTGAVELDELVAIRDDAVVRTHVVRHGILVVFGNRMKSAQSLGARAFSTRHKAAALHFGWHRHARHIEKRLREIEIRNEIAVSRCRASSHRASGR